MHLDADEQPQVPLNLTEPVPVPWWASIIEYETEGSQETGWWEA